MTFVHSNSITEKREQISSFKLPLKIGLKQVGEKKEMLPSVEFIEMRFKFPLFLSLSHFLALHFDIHDAMKWITTRAVIVYNWHINSHQTSFFPKAQTVYSCHFVV